MLMETKSVIKNAINKVKKAIMQEFISKKEVQDERHKKLKLLFKACALVVFADGKVSVEEFMGLDVIFREMEIPDEDRQYFSSCIDKGISVKDIKKELEENEYTEEDLEEIIKMCTSIAKVDDFSKEEKLVIARLRKVFGLKR